jgi:EPS-associated MarR family transcriptional regulator
MQNKMTDEVRYKLLGLIEENPNFSQRELAEKMGVSVGKVNYCVKSLIDVGSIKLKNFSRSNNRSGYAYFLTPKGIKEKLSVTVRFLEYKQQQYDVIQKEIDDLKKEIVSFSK